MSVIRNEFKYTYNGNEKKNYTLFIQIGLQTAAIFILS